MTTNDAVRPVAWRYRVMHDGQQAYGEWHCSSNMDSYERRCKYLTNCEIAFEEEVLYSPSSIAHLQDRVEALTGEVERLQESLDQLSGMNFSDRMHAALVSRAEVAEKLAEDLQKDADRFRWWFSEVRDSTEEILQLHIMVIERDHPGIDMWRSAIDRAMCITQPEADHA